MAASLPASTARWLFLAFFVAFAVKVPLFPLHTWLPDAHTEAPTAGSVLLAGVLLKVGAYGLIRFNLQLFPEASKYFATAVSILALIGIIYGAVVALIQTDIKRLVAYSSVSHLGFVVLGIFAFTNQGVTGGILQMVNHGLSTGALFLLVGMVYERTHTRDLGKMGGLAVVMPWLTGAFLFAVFSSVGLPGLNNFVGEFLVILGSFAVNQWFGALAAIAVVLAAIYLLWSYQRMAYGPIHEEHSLLPDVNLREVLVLAPVLALLLVFGVFPKLLTDRIDPTAQAVVAHVAPDHATDVGDDGRRAGERDRAVIAAPKLEFAPILPELFLCGVAILGLLYEAIAPKAERLWHLALAFAGLIAAALATFPLWHWDGPSTVMRGMVSVDRFSVVSRLLLLGIAGDGPAARHALLRAFGRRVSRGVLPAHPVRHRRDDADHGRGRPDPGVPGARDPVACRSTS